MVFRMTLVFPLTLPPTEYPTEWSGKKSNAFKNVPVKSSEVHIDPAFVVRNMIDSLEALIPPVIMPVFPSVK